LNLVAVHFVPGTVTNRPLPGEAATENWTPQMTLELFHFAWKGMREKPTDTFDGYIFEEGAFELRGRLFMDDFGLVPATLPPRDDKEGEHRFREGKITLSFIAFNPLRADDLEQGMVFEFPIGSRDVRAVIKSR